MKKLLVMALVIISAFAFTACGVDGGSNNSGSQSKNDTPASSEATTEKSEYDIKIKSTALGKDYAKKDIVIVEYEWTNNSEKATSFTIAFQDKAFQDGIECTSTVISDAIDTKQQLTDIQPGKTYTLKVGYALNNTTTPVDIEITDLFGTKTLLKESVKLG